MESTSALTSHKIRLRLYVEHSNYVTMKAVMCLTFLVLFVLLLEELLKAETLQDESETSKSTMDVRLKSETEEIKRRDQEISVTPGVGEQLVVGHGEIVVKVEDMRAIMEHLDKLQNDLDLAVKVLSQMMKSGKFLRLPGERKEELNHDESSHLNYLQSKLNLLIDGKMEQAPLESDLILTDLEKTVEVEMKDNQNVKIQKTRVFDTHMHTTRGMYGQVNEEPSEKAPGFTELDKTRQPEPVFSSLMDPSADNSVKITRKLEGQTEELLINLFYSLWVDVPSRGTYTAESLEALKTYIGVLTKFYPGPYNVKLFLNEVNVWLAVQGPSLSASGWLQKLNSVKDNYEIGFTDKDKRKAIEKAWSESARRAVDEESETEAETKEGDHRVEREVNVSKTYIPSGIWYKVKAAGGFVVGASVGSISTVLLLQPLLRLVGFGQLGVVPGTIAYHFQQFINGYLQIMTPVLAALQSVGSHGLTHLGKIGVGLAGGSVGGLIGLIIML